MNLPPYYPITIHTFSDQNLISQQKQAIQKIIPQLGETHQLYIDGQWESTQETFDSINPANKNELIGKFMAATEAQTLKAVISAEKAFHHWQFTSPIERAKILLNASEIMKSRRFEINAWIIKEIGKNFFEADADTCEAIDFLEFHAREIIRYSKPFKLVQTPGEINKMEYIPVGPVGVITPWNFPMAILMGMATAAIVCGNPVVIKPATDTPMIGLLATKILIEAGVPPKVINFITGLGSKVGNTIVESPNIRMIAFTGSVQVGTIINEKASIVRPGQKWLKRVIAELGGKDAIIVDSEADIDSAVQGVVASAYGFQGQKCSACSRVIVDQAIYDEFVAKLKEETEKLPIGPPEENYKIGPVSSERAFNTIRHFIKLGKQTAKLLTGGEELPGDGFYIKPTVFVDVDPKSIIANEEIFGPVLCVIKANDFDHAIHLHNDTIFGLTGAIYSKNEEKLEKAKKLMHCGNLYLNRKCTGAIVGAQPFGGFNLSGTDSKSGGHDYLQLFLQAKIVCEKVLKK